MSDYSVYELMDSMSGSITNESEGGEVREVNRRFLIGRCEGGFDEAVTAIQPYAPEYGNSSGNYWLRKRLNIQGIGNAYFDCTATYQTLQPKGSEDNNNNEGDFTPGSISWDTTGHTEHITQGNSEERIPTSAPSFQNAINVSGNSVQGLDVVSPNLRYSETWILPAQVAISCDFIGAVYRLTGTVNEKKFRCFDPGEALFMGGRGQWTGDQPFVSVTFDWECRPNQEFYPFPGAAGMMKKKGWEYLWLKYEDESASGSLIRVPVAAYKNSVYSEASWEDLGVVSRGIGAQRAGIPAQPAAAGGNGVA